MSECVVWDGAFKEGYPMLGSRRAHRVAYEAEHGAIPSGHVLHHDCENPACVNPAHLRPLTPRDHILLHRSWEASLVGRREQTHCKHGHPLDGTTVVNGQPRRFCRECRRQDVRARYWRKKDAAVRRLSSMLPQSPAFAQALEADETAVEPPAGLEDGGQA